MAEFTDISQLGFTKPSTNITVVPEEETIMAKELTEGEGSNLIGAIWTNGEVCGPDSIGICKK